jgi:hypothetical protein
MAAGVVSAEILNRRDAEARRKSSRRWPVDPVAIACCAVARSTASL